MLAPIRVQAKAADAARDEEANVTIANLIFAINDQSLFDFCVLRSVRL